METAVEEFLRMESSNQLGNRRAVSDTVLGGVAIAAGSYVHICIGAANRDPEQFPDPDRLDIRRRAEPASRLRDRHSRLRRHVARPHGGAGRDRPIAAALCPDRAGRHAGARAAAPASAALRPIRCG